MLAAMNGHVVALTELIAAGAGVNAREVCVPVEAHTPYVPTAADSQCKVCVNIALRRPHTCALLLVLVYVAGCGIRVPFAHIN